MHTHKHSKRATVLFGYAIGGWLLAFTAAHLLAPAAQGLFRDLQGAALTTQLWWQLIPWLAVAVLSVDYCIVLRCLAKENNTKVQVSKYYVSLGLAFLFVVLTFWPLNVLL